MKRYIIALILTLSFNLFNAQDMSFKNQNNLPIIVVTINGHGGKILLDTGSSISIIDESLKKHYGFRTYPSDNVVTGLYNNKEAKGTSKITVLHKGEEIDIDFISVDMSGIRKKLGIVGIIGSDYFRKNNVMIDFKTNSLVNLNK